MTMILYISRCMNNESAIREIISDIKTCPDIIITGGDVSSPEILDFLSSISSTIVAGIIGEYDDPSVSKWLKTKGILLDGKAISINIGQTSLKIAGLGVNVNEEVIKRLQNGFFDVFVTYYPPLLVGLRYMQKYLIGYGFVDEIISASNPRLVLIGLNYGKPLIVEEKGISYISPSSCSRGGYVLFEYDLGKVRIISYR
ncbi:MAG: hypothetical protein GXO43_02555 [Crenarchaeota archaeon]|nr:hypothetical protein [Thermoproteota archaeon]